MRRHARRRARDGRRPQGVRRPAPVHPHPAQADDRRGQRRRPGRRGGPDGGLRPGGRRRDRPHRLPGGPARTGRRHRHARPDPPGRRPPCPAAAPDRRADLRRAGPRLGAGQRRHAGRARAWTRRSGSPRALVECGPSALATTKRLLDETEGRPPNLRGAAAISAVIRASEEAQEGIARSSRNGRRDGPRRRRAQVSDRHRTRSTTDVGMPRNPRARRRTESWPRTLRCRSPGWPMRRSGACCERTAAALSRPRRPGLPGLGLRWSWRELDERVDRIAASLIAHGGRAGRARRHLVDERARNGS